MSRIALFAAMTLFSVDALAYRTAAWIPAWDSAALESVQRNAGHLDESNPVWYALDEQGRIVPMWNAENLALTAALSGTALVPTLQNAIDGRFDEALVRELISTASARERHAEEITRLVVEKAFDGIDVDYEAMARSDRESFTAFVRLLASKLHSAGKTLSVTVHPKTSDSQDWNGPGAHDYAAIGEVADSVKLMVYDYHWSTSGPGAITPLDWAANVVGYALSVIPADKVMVGLPWYGYDWKGSVGTGIVYREALALAQSSGSQITRDSSGEAVFRYSDHVVHFQDAQSWATKVAYILQRHPQVGGFTAWRVGGEDPAVWDELARLRGDAAPAPSTPDNPPDFLISGPAAVTLAQGASTGLRYDTAALHGFSSPLDVRVIRIDTHDVALTLSSQEIRPGDPLGVTVNASTTAKPGVRQAVLRFTSGALVKDVSLDITIEKKKEPRSRGAVRR